MKKLHLGLLTFIIPFCLLSQQDSTITLEQNNENKKEGLETPTTPEEKPESDSLHSAHGAKKSAKKEAKQDSLKCDTVDFIKGRFTEILDLEPEERKLTLGLLRVYQFEDIPIEFKGKINIQKAKDLKDKGEKVKIVPDIDVKTVSVEIKNGYIRDIKVIGVAKHPALDQNIEVIFYTNYPHSITNYNPKHWGKVYLKGGTPGYTDYQLKLSNILSYTPVNNRVFPVESEHTFRHDADATHEYKIERDWGIGANLEGSLYTGADNVSESFGIIQSEVVLKVTTNTGRWSPKLPIVFFNESQIKFYSNKYDSQFDTLITTFDEDRINITEMYARAFRQLNFSTSVIHFDGMFEANLDFGYQLNLVRVDDTTDTFSGKSISTHGVFFGPSLHFPMVKKYLSLDVSPRFIFHGSMNNLPGKRIKRKQIWIYNPEVVLNYFPTGEQTSGMHFRWVLFDNLNYSEDDVMYWQIGYTLNINKLIKGSFSASDAAAK